MRIVGPELDGSFSIRFEESDRMYIYKTNTGTWSLSLTPPSGTALMDLLAKAIAQAQPLWDGFDREADEQRSRQALIDYYRHLLEELESEVPA
jgi:hypothetical protein